VFEMIEEIRELREEAASVGIATVIWSYPRGGKLPKSGELAWMWAPMPRISRRWLARISSR
jgi:hypothetical protein